jgi:AraC-like DNA-binding protein
MIRATARASIPAPALGAWAYRELRLPALSALVDRVWHSDGTAAFPRKRVLPNGRVEVLINLGPPIRIAQGAGIGALTDACVSGLQSAPLVIEMAGRHAVLGIRLTPAGAYALFGAAAGEASGWTVELDALAGMGARELAGRCREAATAGGALRTAAMWLAAHMAEGRRVAPALAHAAARIERSAGIVAIGTLAAEAGLSRPRFAGAFEAQIGVKPKLFARIQRFHRLLYALHADQRSLAELALDAGYYDQPHMTAECRAFSGLTPAEYRDAIRYMPSLGTVER